MAAKKDLTPVNLVDEIKFVVKKGLKFNNPIIIEGFQGVGLVGTLAAQYLSQNGGDFEQIGYVDSEGIPPLALLVNGEILNPVKIFANKNQSIIIIESELSIPRKIIYELSEEIAQWAKKIGAKEVVCIEGLAVPEKERNYEVFGLSTDPKELKKLAKAGVEKLENGIVIGMSAALLLKAKELKVPATCLMVESRAEFPDGLAAAKVLEVMSKIYGFKVNVKELRDQANAFESKIDKVLASAQHLKQIEGGPSFKGDGSQSIYG